MMPCNSLCVKNFNNLPAMGLPIARRTAAALSIWVSGRVGAEASKLSKSIMD
jgi:hypothetical protein